MKGLASRATLVAFIFSLLAAGYLIVAPTYHGVATSSSPDAAPTITETRTTLIQENGWGVLLPVTTPVLICVAAWLLHRKRPARSIAAILITAFVVVAGFSIGLFYAPSAVAMIIAAIARS